MTAATTLPKPSGDSSARAPARYGFARIRWKLFGLISVAVALPVAFMAIYFSATQVEMLSDMLSSKARSLALLLRDELSPAIAFDDAQTTRELFASVATDEDVAYLALYRANGKPLYTLGDVPPDAPRVLTAASEVLKIHDADDHLRIATPVVSVEGPRGLLVVGLTEARVEAASARVNRESIFLGLGMLLLGCGAALFVGTSLGRRIARVKQRADEVAAGDLAEAPLSDASDDEIGQMARAFQVMVTMFETKVAERTAALVASREQFRRLLESTNAIPWQADPETGRMLYLGPQAAQTFGATHEAMLETAWWAAHMSAEDLAKARIAGQAFSTGEDSEVEFTVRCDDGRAVSIRSIMSAANDGKKRSLMGFMLDVTHQRQLELDLQQAQKLESIGRLAAGVAHEINTPIQFVSDSVHFIRDAVTDVFPLITRYRELHGAMSERGLGAEVAELKEAEARADVDFSVAEVPEALRLSLEGLERVTKIVKAMKQFAHPEQSAKAPADINAALAATLTIAANEYRFVADIETHFGDLPWLKCQVGEINQAFLNIIVNAAHAIADHQKDGERGRITVTTLTDDSDLIVRIADTGGGIPEAVRARIFDPFFTTKEVGRGTGQGLAIARNVVVDKHGGRLGFETEIGRGTTFEIRLPHERPADALALAA